MKSLQSKSSYWRNFPLPSRSQVGIETTKKGSSFLFDYVYLLYQKCQKKKKKSESWWILYRFSQLDSMNTMIKNDNKCCQYAAAVTLNHKETEKHSEGIKKIQSFQDKYNWEGIIHQKGVWKKIEKK